MSNNAAAPDGLMLDVRPIIERFHTFLHPDDLALITQYISTKEFLELALMVDPENDHLDGIWDAIVINADQHCGHVPSVDWTTQERLEPIILKMLSIIDSYLSTLVPNARYPDVVPLSHLPHYEFRYGDYAFSHWSGSSSICLLLRRTENEFWT